MNKFDTQIHCEEYYINPKAEEIWMNHLVRTGNFQLDQLIKDYALAVGLQIINDGQSNMSPTEYLDEMHEHDLLPNPEVYHNFLAYFNLTTEEIEDWEEGLIMDEE